MMLIDKNGVEHFKDVPANRIPKHKLEELREVLVTETHKGHPFFSLEERANLNKKVN